MIMSRAKRIKVVGKWAADRGYDAWNIFQGKKLWCRLIAVTKEPISLILKNYPAANINWDEVRATKLT